MQKAVALLALAGWSVVACNDNTPKAGVVHPYKPKKREAFAHDIHTRVNGIDCKYCHRLPGKGKSSRLPIDVKVCLSCHKTVRGNNADTAAR